MCRNLPRWIKVGLIVAMVLAFSLLTGDGVQADTNPDISVHACVNNANGNIRIVANTVTSCPTGRTFRHWNVDEGTLGGQLASAYALRAGGNSFTGNQSIMSGNVGIGTAGPTAKAQVNALPIDFGAFSLSSWNGTGNQVPLFANNTVPSTDAGGNVQTALPSLVLSREGRSSVAYANFAEFKLSRYLHSGVNANTQLDIALAAGEAAAAGTNVMSLRSNGNVGIGTTGPSEKLHLDNGSIFINGEGQGVILDAGGNKRVGFMKYLGREAGLWRTVGENFQIGRVDGTDIKSLGASPVVDVFVSGSGNVGIGTTGPGSKLSVAGAAGTVTGISFGPYSGITASRYIGITKPSDEANLATNSGFSGIEFGPPQGTGEGYLAFHTHDFGGASAEQMRIDKSGNVGIGTTSPEQKLDVAGSVKANAFIATEPHGNFASTNGNFMDVSFDPGYFRFFTPGLAALPIKVGGIAVTSSYGNTAPLNGAFIQGRVGIGTADPQSALQVSGYTQLDLTSGSPPAADCNEASERGRMKVDSAASLLYVCMNSGWVTK
jgi:hypothetical protein